jgi:hypothetical protein
VVSESSFETGALACAKTADPPPGSWHFGPGTSFTGHFGPGLGESQSGTAVATGPSSFSYPYSLLCTNWVTLAT